MSSEWVMEAGAADFQEKVIAASHEQLVLVDFWAQWCGPCQSLAPVLEQLAQQLQGKLRIVKVDTDAEPELAGQFGVRSLPTLILFRAGELATQMLGAQPLGALKEALLPYLPRPGDAILAQAKTQFEKQQFAAAASALSEAIEREPDDYRLHPVLAEAYLETDEVNKARDILKSLPANVATSDDVQRVEARVRLLEAAQPQSDDPLDRAYHKALHLAAGNNYTDAMDELLGILAQDKLWQDGAARKAMLDIFAQMPSGAPQLREYRSKLARTLN